MGIYSWFEDKWYLGINYIDQYIPIAKVTDKIDSFIPSFILFSILILLLIVGIFFINQNPQNNEIEFIILDESNLPLNEAEIIALDSCGNETNLLTGIDGKTFGELCFGEMDLSVTKKGFGLFSNTIQPDEKKIVINLKRIQIPQKEVYIKVVDEDNKTIIGAEIEINCNGLAAFSKKDQTEEGFKVTLQNCSSTNISAYAKGYEEKTYPLNKTDERKIITLKKIELTEKIVFITKNIIQEEGNVEIFLKNKDTGFEFIHITNEQGLAETELKVGDYTFIATNKSGVSSSGSFILEKNKKKTVEILLNYNPNLLNLDETKKVYLRVIDNKENAIITAKASIFIDKNIVSRERRTNTNGIITPFPLNESNVTKKISAYIEAPGFESTFVNIIPKIESDSPQIVVLEQGGSSIKVKVVDDRNLPIKESFVRIIYLENNFELVAPLKMDNNGEGIFKNLPKGDYKIISSDPAGMDNSENIINLKKNETKELLIQLITGQGKIKFRFFDEQTNKALVNYKLIEIKENENIEILASSTKKDYFDTPLLKSGTKVKVIVEDENFFYTESISHRIKRTSQEHIIFVRSKTSLPNSNETQVFLKEIYSENPLNGKISKASKIFPKESYFLLFELLVNNSSQDGSVANFFVGPKDKNVLDNKSIFSIESIASEGMIYLSSLMKGPIINSTEDTLVDDYAKQGNSVTIQTTPLSTIPILVEIKIADINTGNEKLFFESLLGQKKSLLYDREIIIGKEICINDCPAFLFSNFIKKNNEEFKILEDYDTVLFGENYSIKTIVDNLTDNDFDKVYLRNSIPKEHLDYLLFDSDKNTFLTEIILYPASFFSTPEYKILLKKEPVNVKSVYINQSIEKNGDDLIDSLPNNDNKIALQIKKKDILEISVDPLSIDAKTEYPFFVIKTKYKGKSRGASAYWMAQDESLDQIASGKTDANGVQIINLSTLSFNEGDKIIFTAYDSNGSIEGKKEITLGYYGESIDVTEKETCIKLKYEGVAFGYEELEIMSNIDSDEKIVLVSECEEELRGYIYTDLLVSEIYFTINPGEEKEITITTKPKTSTDGNSVLLGVYPVQIMGLNLNNYKEINYFDVIINDPNSCFDLNQAIFDFRTTGKLSSSVFNKCFSGRQDNYYPKLELNTNSAALSYKKPGIPVTFSESIPIWVSAVESIILGGAKSEIISAKRAGHFWGMGNYQYLQEETSELINETLTDLCESKLYEGDGWDVEEKIIPEKIQRVIPNFNNSEPLPEEGTITNSPNNQVKRLTLEGESGGTLIDASPADGETGTLGPVSAETEKEINSPPIKESGLVYYWNPNTYDAIGNATQETIEDPGFWKEQLLGDRCSAYNSGDPQWELSPWGNLDDSHVMEWKQISHKRGFTITAGSPQGGETENAIYFKVTLSSPCNWGGMLCQDSDSKTQVDYIKVVNYLASVDEKVDIDFSIKPIEDKVYKIGSYYGEVVTPRWTDKEDMFGEHKAGESFVQGNQLITVGCITPQGFVPWDYATSIGHQNADGCDEMPIQPDLSSEYLSPQHPLIDYAADGVYRYHVKEDDVPEGLSVYLYQGNVYVEYVGVPEINDSKIDFNIQSNNFMGREYATLTVQDWTGAEVNSNNNTPLITPEEVVFSPTLSSFLWKPIADTGGGKLAVLYSPNAQGNPEIHNANGDLLEVGVKYGGSNGYGQTVRFSKQGSQYPNGSYFQVGQYKCKINNTSARTTSCVSVSSGSTSVYQQTPNLNKEVKQFQIKLRGHNTTCVSKEGDLGQTGKAHTPKLLYDWDWKNINTDACDSSNNEYIYCDAAQFTTTIFKKLSEINEVIKKGGRNIYGEIAKETSFYAYLMKDNYSPEFLQDYSQYYKTNIINALPFFNSGENFSQLIDLDKMTFISQNNKTILPDSGLYRVSIDMVFDNNSLFAMFDHNKPNVKIKITLMPHGPRKNLSALYYLPFDGEIGKTTRTNYGTSVINGELKLNSNSTVSQTANALNKINFSTTTNLDSLNKGILFKYDSTTKKVSFNPMQPNPISMTITGKTPSTKSGYTISGTNSNTLTQMNWLLSNSNLGGNKCLDFEENAKIFFDITKNSDNEYNLAWDKVRKEGKLTLSTILFTPTTIQVPLRITPLNETNTTIDSYSMLDNSTSVMLNYYDSLGISTDNLKTLFEMIEEEKLCISQEDSEIVIFWNNKYLDKIKKEANPNKANYCN